MLVERASVFAMIVVWCSAPHRKTRPINLIPLTIYDSPPRHHPQLNPYRTHCHSIDSQPPFFSSEIDYIQEGTIVPPVPFQFRILPVDQ
ncbi:hypothetical protein L228DRAFT_248101 [Xylona heveae TC161]|uniref:Uncharacterized protein n=1 Tax=Xylona heveae (strain CBS 132557 / TC161) TaxID=1328760 RepID=A0A165GP26_XYLHT|nr:hypothetical protein L228DRAFT_248101 [Xylona heveae TC161]KZF22422.1 hypothetical protein L228DRAFT_248101 [Xylona heveae TC161]